MSVPTLIWKNQFDDAMAMLRYSIEEERKAKPKLNRNLKGGL